MKAHDSVMALWQLSLHGKIVFSPSYLVNICVRNIMLSEQHCVLSRSV